MSDNESDYSGNMSEDESDQSYSPVYVEEELTKYGTDIEVNSKESRGVFLSFARRFFEKIKEILSACMDIIEECPEETKYEVYRSLNKTLRFLWNIKSKNFYSLLSNERAREVVCGWMEGILEKIDHGHTFDNLVSGFKEADCLYSSYSHKLVYSQIGHRVKMLLTLLQRDSTDIRDWKPTESLYMHTEWLGLIVVTDDIVIITRKKYETRDPKDIREGLSFISFRSSAKVTEMDGKDQLDWSLKKPIDRKNCPATYTIKSCDGVEPLLEMAARFISAVVALEAIESSNVDYIFLMCKALLDQGSKFIANMDCGEMFKLFNVVYGILDYILPFVVECNGDEDFIIKISKECSYVLKLSSPFEKHFEYPSTKYEDYMDILYKYLVVYIKPADVSFPEWKFFFKEKFSSTAIHKGSKPKDFTVCFEDEDVKFINLVERNSLNPEDSNFCCGICLQALNFTKPTTISFLEKCGDAFCIECIMETVNRLPGGAALESLPNSFRCPRDDCSDEDENLISGEQFGNFLLELCNPTDSLDEGYGVGSASGSKAISKRISAKPLDEAGCSKDMLPIPSSSRKGEPDSLLVDDDEDDSQATNEASDILDM